jgi:hypothetical protein
MTNKEILISRGSTTAKNGFKMVLKMKILQLLNLMIGKIVS